MDHPLPGTQGFAPKANGPNSGVVGMKAPHMSAVKLARAGGRQFAWRANGMPWLMTGDDTRWHSTGRSPHFSFSNELGILKSIFRAES